ncbi:TPA: hypothetical protein N2D99_002437 [Clostridium botulinum]|nr:hypothetical protein [Clostridium botulinum]
MDIQKLNERIQRISSYIISERVNNRELKAYLKGTNNINGEDIRSYFITYCDGIRVIWRELINLYKEEYIKIELDLNAKVAIEEALEKVDFDNMFAYLIEDIKNL